MHHPHSDEVQNFAAYASTGDKKTLAGEQVSRSALLERLSPLPEIFQAIGRMAEDPVRDWKIADREPLPSYQKNRLCLIGDAAHPMRPRLGQGASQSIEDGATLGVLMSNLNSAADVPARLRLYDSLRIRRTAIVQLMSRARGGPDTSSVNRGGLSQDALQIFEKYPPVEGPRICEWNSSPCASNIASVP
jgi:salicylate hydroxylase